MSSSPVDMVVALSCSGCGQPSSSTFKALVSDPVVRCGVCGAHQYIATPELEHQSARAQVLLRALDKTMRHAARPPSH